MKRGDKVTCNDDTYTMTPHTPKEYASIKRPEKGKRYTVRDVIHTDYGIGIRLEEIVNPKIHHDVGGWREPIFKIEKFSPSGSNAQSATKDIISKFSPVTERLDIKRIKR